jgi:hypothetical protein
MIDMGAMRSGKKLREMNEIFYYVSVTERKQVWPDKVLTLI